MKGLAKGTEYGNSTPPEYPAEITLCIKARLFHWPGHIGSTTLRLKFADCEVSVYDNDSKPIGSITGCIGGSWELGVKGDDPNDPSHQYLITPQDIWAAFCQAIDRPDLNT